MTLLSDLVIEVQRRTLSSMREEINQLGANYTAGGTTIQLAAGQTLGSIQPGSIVQIDYELMLVQSAASPSSITVVPGYYDSTTASHSNGALITVNPRFPAVDIVRAINEDIDDLSSPVNGLYQAAEITLTYNPVYSGYDLTDVNTSIALTEDAYIDLLQVRVHEYGPAQLWPKIPLNQCEIQNQADTSQFPSGMAFQFTGNARGYAGRPIRIQYKSPYTTPLIHATDNVQTVTGLHPQAHDIPTLGAAYRLMAFREFKRSFTEAQPEPRRAQEVPVGASLTAVKLVAQQRMDRIAAERARLDRRYRTSWR